MTDTKTIPTRQYAARGSMAMTPALLRAGYRPSDALLEKEGFLGTLSERRQVDALKQKEGPK